MRHLPLLLLALLATACAELSAQAPLAPAAVSIQASPSATPSPRPTRQQAVIPPPPQPVLQPVATPAPAATPVQGQLTPISTPSPRPTPAPSACPGGRGIQVAPSNTGPGGLLYVLGTGFGSSTQVWLGTRKGQVVQRSDTRLVVKVPADFDVSDVPLEVRIVGCEAITVGTVTVDLPAAGAAVPQQGLLAQRFVIPSNLRRFPDDGEPRFGLKTFIAAGLDTPRRAAANGEAFAVSLFGRLNVPIAGITKFRVFADDGVRILIDNQAVIDAPESNAVPETSALVSLTAGLHEFRLDYFQASSPELGLDVFWTLPNSLEGRLPPEALIMPENSFLSRP